MNRRSFFGLTAGLTTLFSGVKAFAFGKSNSVVDKLTDRQIIDRIKSDFKYIGNHFEFRKGCSNEYSLQLIVYGMLESHVNQGLLQTYRFTTKTYNSKTIKGDMWLKLNNSDSWIVFDYEAADCCENLLK